MIPFLLSHPNGNRLAFCIKCAIVYLSYQVQHGLFPDSPHLHLSFLRKQTTSQHPDQTANDKTWEKHSKCDTAY